MGPAGDRARQPRQPREPRQPSEPSLASHAGLGPVGRRLMLAFVLVTTFSLVVVTAAAVVGVGRGLTASQDATRQAAATSSAAAAATAYAAAGGWSQADLSQASAVAEASGARLFVMSAGGQPVGAGHAGAGQGQAGQGQAGQGQAGQGQAGQGQGGAGPAGGTGVVSAPVTVGAEQVGTVRLVFPPASLTRARDVAWTWIGVAAMAALLLAVAAGWGVTWWVTGPILRTTRAARAFAAGDRSVRTIATGPGELAELGQAVNSMADAVVRSEREQRTLTADVAHELRTPLAALQAGLEELRDGFVEPDPARLAALHDQALRLGRVVGDLAELSAAEAEAGGASLRRTLVDLASLAADEVAARTPQLRTAGLDVDLHTAGPVAVLADPDRLHQVLGNLLANAARYCRVGDRVDVHVRTDAGRAVLEVVDTGPGIPPDELPHVLERLWRGRGAAHVAGSGIGLAVAREIVTAHGGTIEIASAGRGTRVTVHLPAAPGVDPRPVAGQGRR